MSLRKADLKEAPDCSIFAHLQSLDLSQNQIKSLKHLHSQTLKKLCVIGNLFSSLSLNISYLPSLDDVTFGSDKCHFVDLSVVRSDINLNVSNDYSQNLIFPLASVLKNKEPTQTLFNIQEFRFPEVKYV